MKTLQPFFAIATNFRQNVNRLHIVALLGVLAATSSLRAESLRICTDTTWRAIGPAGNQEGTPIRSVGLGWEAAHKGWNKKVGFDDSDEAGWRAAIVSAHAGTEVGATNSIWVDGNGYNGSTPAYFRKVFSLCGTVRSAILNVHVDDDAQVYLNGKLILDDHNAHADDFYEIDVTSRLTQGQNLLAIKAHDSFGIGEQLAADLTIEFQAEAEEPERRSR